MSNRKQRERAAERRHRVAIGVEEIRRGRSPEFVLEMVEAMRDAEDGPQDPTFPDLKHPDVSRLSLRILNAVVRSDPQTRPPSPITEMEALRIIKACAAKIRALTHGSVPTRTPRRSSRRPNHLHVVK